MDDIVEGIIRTSDSVANPNPNLDSIEPDPANDNASYRIFNIGESTPLKLSADIETMEQLLGMTAEKDLLPLQSGDVPAIFADVSELETVISFRPSTPVRRGGQDICRVVSARGHYGA